MSLTLGLCSAIALGLPIGSQLSLKVEEAAAQSYGTKHYKSPPLRRKGVKRSGVNLGSSSFVNTKTRSRGLFQRRALIEQQNRRIVIENQLRSERRRASVLANPERFGRLDGNFRQTIIDDPAFNGGAGTHTSFYRGTQPCPAKHNCGYRIYQDGSGPRIIAPGIYGKDLPKFDGIRGPVIIVGN